MDFGIARFTEAEGLTDSGIMVGTPEYMSPEQAETVEVDKRSDIYALGVILYEMVTGRVPFAGETPLAVLIKHKQEPPRNPQESNPLVSEDVTRIILKCLSKDKASRYQSAEELFEDLTLAERALPQAEKSVVTRPSRRTGHPVKPWIWAGMGLALVLALIIVWAQFLRKEPVRMITDEAGRAGRVHVIEPPQPPPVSESQAEKSLERKSGASRSLLSLLNPDALRKLSEKEIQSILDFEKQMAAIKGVIPQGAAFDETWTSAYQKVREGNRLHEEGRIEEAQKSKKEGQDEMQKLLTMVAQRDKALEAKSILTETKARLRDTAGIDGNVLYRVATRREQDADNAFNNSDFSGSRTLSSVLVQVFRLSGQCSDAGSCLRSLAALVADMRSSAESSIPAKIDPWLFEKAKDYEGNAQRALVQNNHEGAAEQYIQAAFLYQKMIDQTM